MSKVVTTIFDYDNFDICKVLDAVSEKAKIQKEEKKQKKDKRNK